LRDGELPKQLNLLGDGEHRLGVDLDRLQDTASCLIPAFQRAEMRILRLEATGLLLRRRQRGSIGGQAGGRDSGGSRNRIRGQRLPAGEEAGEVCDELIAPLLKLASSESR
jgi:hypothetical protein